MNAPAERAAVLTVPTLLSVANVATVLGCSGKTVRRRIADGTIPAVMEQGRVMVRGDELRGYIDRLERAGDGTRPRRVRARAAGRYDFLRDTPA